jgi:type IV secretory pathway VirB10-like protein
MGNLKKILAVLFLSIIVSVNLIGCGKKDQKSSASKPQKENVQNEHPSDDKASSEHPEHPSKEHGKSEHPEHPSKENEKSEHPEHPEHPSDD